MPLLAYCFAIILIQKTGYNFPVMIFSLLTILAGVIGAIFEGGNSASSWEIVVEDQLARFAMNGLKIFIVFWATNYSKFGGKNGVLGVIYLSCVYGLMGLCDWAWNKWDTKFENWWLEKIGGKDSKWDTTVCALITLIGWFAAFGVQRLIRKNE